MKTLSFLQISVLCGLSVFALASCSEDKDDPKSPEVIDATLSDPETIEYKGDDKDYLERTAIEFLNYFNPQDQRKLIDLCNYYYDELSDYDFPENFDDDYSKAVSRNLMSSLATNSYYKISRRVQTYTYNMSRFKGVYEPNPRKETWVYVEDSEDCVFRFVDNKNNKCEVRVSGANGSWSYTAKDDYDEYIIEVPKKLVLTINSGSDNLVTAIINTDYVENKSIKANVEAKVMNLYVESNTDATNSRVKENMRFAVNNKILVKAEAEVEGNDICNFNTWENTFDRYEGGAAAQRMISKGSAKVTLMNSIAVEGKITDVKNFVDYVDFWVDNYDSDDPEKEAKEAAKKLNNSMEASMKYVGKDGVKAKFDWEAYQSYYDSYYDWYYNEWSLRPIITFTSDNSSYDFESYFGDGNFFKVEDLFENIVDKYDAYF